MNRCAVCGSSLAGSVDGQCAVCLMRLGMAGELASADEPAVLAEHEGTADSPEVAGRRIGNYELIDTIARGGMGIVYRARQLTAGRTVALKVMLPHLLHMPGMLLRFRQEVEAVAKLDHPGILPVYEVGEHDGLPFFSMKLAEGGALDARQSDLLGDWRAIAIVIAKVARAVEHAHGRGVLHRDLKPANILFDAAGEPAVADFGLVKFRALERGLTLPTFALGSPHYMAPEQISAEFGEVGPATDVYGLGAILYELLTGAPLINAEDPVKALRMITTATPLQDAHSLPGVPAALYAIARKCLAKDPAQRYQSAASLAEDLERWLGSGNTAAFRESRRGRVAMWGGVALFVLVAVAGAVFMPRGFVRSGESASAPSAVRTTPTSLAVLPFRNAGGEEGDDQLATSIADDLLFQARQISAFAVLPFRVDVDTTNGIPSSELVAKLGVQQALDGEFIRAGEQLKVTARLWDAATGKRLWQYRFEIPVGELRDMRTQIATTLVSQLQVQLGGEVGPQAGYSKLTSNKEALDHYVRARYLIRWRRAETLTEAARLLRAAIAIDPGFARAHSALSYCYALWMSDAPPEGDPWELSRQYAHSALALDPTLGEPYAVLGDHASVSGEFMAAEEFFSQAIKRDAQDPATLHFQAIHFYSVGKLRAALEAERRSVALDASSPQPMMFLAMLTTLLGEEREARRLWALSDELGAARPLSAAILRLGLGDTEFLSEWYALNWYLTGLPARAGSASTLLAGLLDQKDRPEALALLRTGERDAKPAFLITQYALLGDADSAVRIARRFNLADDGNYLYQLATIWAPQTASLRRDPRFGELLQKWGFVDYWRKYGTGDLCDLAADGAVTCR